MPISSRSRRGSVRRLRQRRTGLLRAVTHPGRAAGVQPLRRTAGRCHSRRPRRRSRRRGTEMGPLVSEQQRETVAPSSKASRSSRRSARGPRHLVPCTSSRRRTTTASLARRSSAPSPPSFPSRTRRTRCGSRTTRPTAVGSIWTRDGARALRVARALETGVLSVNSNSSVRVQTPFGGMKMSGSAASWAWPGWTGTPAQERVRRDGELSGQARGQGVRDHRRRWWDGSGGGDRLHGAGRAGLCRRCRPRCGRGDGLACPGEHSRLGWTWRLRTTCVP